MTMEHLGTAQIGEMPAGAQTSGDAPKPWTAGLVADLTRLWTQQEPELSAADIARIIGVPKNAVTSKARRLGLPSRPSPIRRSAGAAPKKKPAAKPSVASAPPAGRGSRRFASQPATMLSAPAPGRPSYSKQAIEPLDGTGLRFGEQTDRQCCAPLWDNDTALEARFVCGRPVGDAPGARRARLCEDHARAHLTPAPGSKMQSAKPRAAQGV